MKHYSHSSSSQAIFNLITPARTTTSMPDGGPRADFITVWLAYLLSLVPIVDLERDEIAVMARQINLALVGVIILSSIRLVLRGVARVRATNGPFLISTHISLTSRFVFLGFESDQPQSRSVPDAPDACPADDKSPILSS